jgi:hypothetical protein
MARPAESNVQGGDGRDDVNEGVDDGSMLGQIENLFADGACRPVLSGMLL